MAGIYANAYVTVVAGNGWDADHGLQGIRGVTESRNLSSSMKSNYHDNLQPYSSIWYSRRWTFQEMVVSPRKIMFQYHLATWECNQASWYESEAAQIFTPSDALLFQPSTNPLESRVRFSPWPDIGKSYISLCHGISRI